MIVQPYKHTCTSIIILSFDTCSSSSPTYSPPVESIYIPPLFYSPLVPPNDNPAPWFRPIQTTMHNNESTFFLIYLRPEIIQLVLVAFMATENLK